MLRRKCWVGTLGWLLLLLGSFHFVFPQKSDAEDLLPASRVTPDAVTFERQSYPVTTTFSVSIGPRRDDFDWSIAGRNNDGLPVDVRSELEWDNVQSYQFRLENRTQLGNFLYFRGYFDYAVIKDGAIRDSDYDGPGGNVEYSRSISTSSGDQLWDVSGGLGYPFQIDAGRSTSFLLVPMLGVSLHKQNYRITDGYQVITEPGGPELGPLEGLNSTFEAKWMGPWLGLDLHYRLTASAERTVPMEFGLFMEYHFLTRYRAEANWNLREDFEHPKSFEQEADGRGICLTGEWIIRPWSRWDLQFMVTYQTWKTQDGTIRFFSADGTSSTARLNEIRWDTHSVMAGITYHFF